MKLNFFVSTDVHGSIFPTNYTTLDNVSNCGLAKMKTAILENVDDKFILVDNGDSFQGSPLVDYALSKYKRNIISEAFNDLNYDFYNLGNHDFNYKEEVLLDFIKNNKATLLTSNILYKDKPLGSTQVIEVDDKKFALIGVTTHYIVNWEEENDIKNFSFIDAYTQLKNEVIKYRDSVDYVIAFYHGGFERDLKSKEALEELTGENQGYQMSEIKGLDILFTGHQHQAIIDKVNDTYVSQSTQNATMFTKATIDTKTDSIHLENIKVDNYKADSKLLDKYSKLNDEVQVYLDEPIGKIENVNLIIEDGFLARLNKHPLVSFINTVQLDESKADISAVALFNDSKGFNKEITIRDIVSTYPFANTLVVKEVSGKVLKAAIEFSAQYFTLDKDNNIVVDEKYLRPKPQHYNYDMFDGVDYTIKVSNEIGNRVVDLKHKDKAVKDDDIFKLVVSNYRANGGGNYNMIKEAKTIKSIAKENTTLLINYLKNNSPINLEHKNNIKVIV